MRLMIVGLVAALTGCATVMNEEDCASADWALLGEADGRAGAGPEKFVERADRCASFGFDANAPRYDEGRARGLDTYCTPDAGYEAGRSGDPYRGVCPLAAEEDFLAEYDVGRRLYLLTTAYESARSAYDSAVSSIDYNRRSIRRARDRLRNPDLSDEDRTKLERNIERDRREIENLEDDLPRLAANADDAFGELEDFRAFLNRRLRRR